MSDRFENVINLRVTDAQTALIERAAEVAGQTRASFMLEAAVSRAHAVLADRVRFVVSDEKFAAFQRALDEPLPNPDALRRLFECHAPWE